jgi:hypothetical protein
MNMQIPLRPARTTAVTLSRSSHTLTNDVALWAIIRHSCREMSFVNYKRFMDDVMCAGGFAEFDPKAHRAEPALPVPPDNPGGDQRTVSEYEAVAQQRPHVRPLPFTGVDRYELLKAATEVFVMAKCGVNLGSDRIGRIMSQTKNDQELIGNGLDLSRLSVALWDRYRAEIKLPKNDQVFTLPYYGIIQDKLKDISLEPAQRLLTSTCYSILQEKLQFPCFIELIWSYWHEEGMLIQTMNAIMRRFQNVASSNPDPLVNMEIDPLRPLNNLLWGLIQDELHRLTVHRRAYEYQHGYGLTLLGRAVQNLNPADTRSKFIEAFHNLLYLCSVFYKEDDDTTVVADGFPVLNAVKEVHMLLAEGAHNQYGDLPSTSRQEMMLQQWILARPEFREFLPTRIMVAYEEPWMDRVDAMKKLQGWTDTSIYHFRDLGVFGEQILLSLRFGAWSISFNAEQGANWARFWRTEVQGYMHAYRAVTGVDLTAEVATAEQGRARFLPPSVHLRNRVAQQLSHARAATLPSRQNPVMALSPALINVKGRT